MYKRQGCIFYRYDAPLFFANVGDLRERVDRVISVENQAYPQTPVRWFILNVEANVCLLYTSRCV